MWTRIRESLTLRIFLITAALLAAACALTYGMLAYLTPISYTAMLEDELDATAGALVARLEMGTYADSEAELARFARETGATAEVIPLDEEETAAEPGTMVAYAEVVVQDAVAAADGDEATYAGDAAAQAESSYAFTFADGQEALLVVRGGLRAVNRTAEAMRRVLPYLAAALLLFSLGSAMLYARFITRPVVEISRIARRIAKLDFRARWKRRRRDEIGQLGESLNRLSDSLSGALGELRDANEQLRADIERERELERQRLEFFAATSHELKTPITILKGQLSGMLAQVGAYRDREKYLARALEVANRMEALVKQILTVSRVESGAAVGDEVVDLSALLARQLDQDAELIEARGLMLAAQIAPGVALRGSEKLLSSALDNVLMNAILYSPPGAEIRVSLDAGALRVVNTGARIDESDLAHLFEPFYRAEKSRNRASGGSGLGLYLVKKIFELHGMACAIENMEDGVEFRATIS